MLMSDNGMVQFDGSGEELLMELTALIRALVRAGLGDKQVMKVVVDSACATEEEIWQIFSAETDIAEFQRNILGDIPKREARVSEMMDVVNSLKKERNND